MHLTVNADSCMGHGRCHQAAPDLLTEDEEGFVAEHGDVGEVPEQLLRQARSAVRSCPEGAISLLTDPSAQ